MSSVSSPSIPDVGPWLHGVDHSDRDVRVLWRDFPAHKNQWTEAIQAMPPTIPETARVPIRKLAETGADMIRWRGPDDCTITGAIAPGDVVVVPSGTTSLSASPPTDIAEAASVAANSPRVRLIGPNVLEWLDTLDNEEILIECESVADLSAITHPEIRPYPGGLVVWHRPITSERSGRRVGLTEHSEAVAQRAREIALGCGLDDQLVDELEAAGKWHDVGKADPRMQAWLGAHDELLAKSGHTFAQMRSTWAASGYPRRQRHELLSATLARQAECSELVQHLVASHHGWCRPVVPEQRDSSPEMVAVEWEGHRVAAASDDVCDEHENTFWELQSRLGWWRLAALSGVLVYADHSVSKEDQYAQLPSATS